METSLCVRKAIKNDSKNVNKNSLSFTFCSIFYLLTFSTEKIARWPLVFKTDFYIIFYNDQLMKILRNFIDKFLLYHTSFKNNFYAIFLKTTHIQQLSITHNNHHSASLVSILTISIQIFFLKPFLSNLLSSKYFRYANLAWTEQVFSVLHEFSQSTRSQTSYFFTASGLRNLLSRPACGLKGQYQWKILLFWLHESLRTAFSVASKWHVGYGHSPKENNPQGRCSTHSV